jgi:hypothetical protein
MIHDELRDHTRDYWVSSSVPYLDNPSAIEFMKARMTYHPFIVRGVVGQWKAHDLWTMEYIRDQVGDKNVPVSVNITPDGYADAIKAVESTGR